MGQGGLADIILALGAPLTAAAWYIATLVVRDKSREVVRQELDSMIRSAIREFKDQLVRELNGTYRRSQECLLMMEKQGVMIDTMCAKVAGIEDQFRESRRETTSQIFGLSSSVDAAWKRLGQQESERGARHSPGGGKHEEDD